jgi:hypothetical protein
MTTKDSRRAFIKKSLLAFTALPLAGSIVNKLSNNAFAQALPTTALDINDPMAKALGYVEKTTQIDKTKSPRYLDGQKCKNCMLFAQGGLKVGGKEGEWGKCSILQTGLVSADGWCNSYAAKPA